MKTTLLLVAFASLTGLIRANELDTYEPKPAVPPGWLLLHGDILVRDGFIPAGAARNDPGKYWPGGVVPYEFDANVSSVNRIAMLNAMAEWEAVATVDFVPRTSQGDYVHIQNSTANNSSVGRQTGQQFINIMSWGSRFTMVHELGHCLGYWHTQSRSDRDSFVRVNWGNIQAGQENNFQLESDIFVYGPYDFASVMHYGGCDFSIDCPVGIRCPCTSRTIDVLPPNEAEQATIGQRNQLSTMDRLTMSLLYPPGNWRFVDGAFTGSPNAGTLIRPYRLWSDGRNTVPPGGTVVLQPGEYSVGPMLTKAMTLRAPLGGVTLRN